MLDIYDDQDLDNNSRVRSKKLCKNCKYLVIELLMFAYLFFIYDFAKKFYFTRRDEVSERIRHIEKDTMVWMLVYLLLYTVYLIRRIRIMMIWKCSDDPRDRESKFKTTTACIF